ncbi:HEAT repeat domain-containing protein [Candidatus Cyanaurora vandensis]|uniref:HEAT repeat domain-containing protein n=1 Tax=Candidatus Cyanaurora vandensis TaxID=2714958 RepID=UPI00257AB889|nr:HEAT repeat domain-containing protein [Candidatus Cyanaurora vandensis]
MKPPVLTGGLDTAQVLDLMSGDDQDRYYAVWHSGKYQVKEALPLLLDALTDSACTALGGYPLRRRACEALGKLLAEPGWDETAYQQAVSALLRVLDSSDYWVRSEAIWALGKIAPRVSQPELRADMIRVLREFLDRPEEPFEYVIETLGVLDCREALLPIRGFLHHPSARVRCAAARVVFQFTQETAALNILLENLASHNLHLRRCALLDLGEVGDLSVVPAIARCLLPANLRLFALKQIFDRQADTADTLLLRQTIEELL